MAYFHVNLNSHSSWQPFVNTLIFSHTSDKAKVTALIFLSVMASKLAHQVLGLVSLHKMIHLRIKRNLWSYQMFCWDCASSNLQLWNSSFPSHLFWLKLCWDTFTLVSGSPDVDRGFKPAILQHFLLIFCRGTAAALQTWWPPKTILIGLDKYYRLKTFSTYSRQTFAARAVTELRRQCWMYTVPIQCGPN